jgi:hypothetical protein
MYHCKGTKNGSKRRIFSKIFSRKIQRNAKKGENANDAKNANTMQKQIVICAATHKIY